MERHGYVYELLRKGGLSDFGASTGEFLLVKPLKIVLILVIALIAGRVVGSILGRSIRGFARRNARITSLAPRAEQRAATVGDVGANLVRAIFLAIGVFMVLGEIGLNLAPILAGAGIAGVAIGFGAQSLVKDFFSGLFILLEDQYGVGDVIAIGDASGTVEDLTLRVTRLRATDGTVFFVPNGEIRRVANVSMEWSRALLDVAVGYEADVDEVIALIREEADAFAADPDWSGSILEPPEVWGLQSMVDNAQVVRLVVKCGPRLQYGVVRELRHRLLAMLRAAEIPPPLPAGSGIRITAGSLDAGTPPPPPPTGPRPLRSDAA